MTETVIVALISSGSAVLVAVTALLLNYRGFASIDSRFAALERRLERLQEDNKQFFQWFGRLEADIARIGLH